MKSLLHPHIKLLSIYNARPHVKCWECKENGPLKVIGFRDGLEFELQLMSFTGYMT